jgi:phosphate transport system permease protein
MTIPPGATPRNKATRRRKDKLFHLFCGICAVSSVAMLGTLLVVLILQGIEHLDLDFLKNSPSRKPEKAGIGPAMWGSVWICTICALSALPIGIATAIILEEYKPSNKFPRPDLRYT